MAELEAEFQEVKRSRRKCGVSCDSEGIAGFGRPSMQVNLRTFKTGRCTQKGHHDFQLCPDWHSEKDRRRDPYQTKYMPDEARNSLEKVYHPLLFRTGYCNSFFTRGRCKHERLCAFAHAERELLDPSAIHESLFNESVAPPVEERRTVVLGELVTRSAKQEAALGCNSQQFVSPSTCQEPRGTTGSLPVPKHVNQIWEEWNEAERRRRYLASCIELSRVGTRSGCTDTTTGMQRYPLANEELFVVLHSSRLWTEFEEEALRACCKVNLERGASAGSICLVVIGRNAVEVLLLLRGFLQDAITSNDVQSRYRVARREVKLASSAVVSRLEKDHSEERLRLRDVELWRPGDHVATRKGGSRWSPKVLAWIDFEAKQKMVRIFEIDLASIGSTSGKHPVVVPQILEWIRSQNYRGFECMCCCGDFLDSEGVCCPNGHFICVQGGCFEHMMQSQKPQLQAQNGDLICSLVADCKAVFDAQQVARVAPKATFEKFEDAKVEARVNIKYDDLSKGFDRKLEERVQDLITRYQNGDENEKVRQEAEMGARKARNAALDLRCPGEKCRAVYIDFEGCMALECQQCRKHFCGYCHKKVFESSRQCHEHVRECTDNVTDNSSYYASEEQIRQWHKRFRTRNMKAFLQPYKKAVQNAIVIELTPDLQQLGIDPAALLDLGYLEPDMMHGA